MWVVDAKGTNARAVAAVPYAHSVAWHPKGESLLVSSFAREDGALSLVEVETGEVRQIAEHAGLAAWSSDGAQIYYFTKAGALAAIVVAARAWPTRRRPPRTRRLRRTSRGPPVPILRARGQPLRLSAEHPERMTSPDTERPRRDEV